MADEAKKTLEKLRKLYEAQRAATTAYREKMDAIAHEVETLLNGGAGVGELLKRLETHYQTVWQARYPGAYMWDWKVDRPNWKRLIQKLSVEELEHRVIAYLRDSDDYYIRARHPFLLFVKNINRFASEEHAASFMLDAPTVADCKHQPPCVSDQEHTRLKMSEMKRTA